MLFSVLVSICNNEKEMSKVCKIMLQESQVQTGKRSVSPEKKDEKTIKYLLRGLDGFERHVQVAGDYLFPWHIWGQGFSINEYQ